MGCKARGAANSSTYSQAEQRCKPPEKSHPMRVAAKSGARFVALLGIVAQATTFVALRAIIPISPATRSAWGLCRGSLSVASHATRKRSHVRDEAARRCVRVARVDAVAHCGNQRARQRLAELHAPLVERIDPVERAFDEGTVLV